ncbi:MAG: amidase [Ahrensia sp.]|nr:amidase [Ahrensia sp.]
MPTPRCPDLEELEIISRRFGLRASEDELASYKELIEDTLSSYRWLEDVQEPKLPVIVPRSPGQRPPLAENQLGAWAARCNISTGSGGPLAGKTVAIKDNVAVAGVPMMNGSSMLDGFTPDIDATVVTRILEAGGTITGKSVCEHLCFSGGSHTSDTGPVRNPHDMARNAGGSSSGSAALVASGACDMAIGGDQGGSIRVPSSYCGCVGLKPSFGLVPYTGAAPIERTLDHLGPMASTVRDVALLLDAIAGPDDLDPRQGHVSVAEAPYSETIDEGIENLSVGLLAEGFGWDQSETDVDETVRQAALKLSEAGATVADTSIPLHRQGLHIWTGIAVEGAYSTVVRGNSGGTNAAGYFDTPLIDAFSRAKARNGADFSVTVKLTILLGEYLQSTYGGRYYAKARNISRSLIAAYETALRNHDVIAMPTTPRKATVLPAEDAPWPEIIDRAWECEVNTRPFDVTGHPALAVPCGMSDGLPVSLMLVGRKGGEAKLLRVARAIEQLCPTPRPSPPEEATS